MLRRYDCSERIDVTFTPFDEDCDKPKRSRCDRFSGTVSFCIVLTGLISAGCEKTKAAADTKAAPSIKVEVALPTSEEVVDYRDYTGRVKAVDSVEIRARVSGY